MELFEKNKIINVLNNKIDFMLWFTTSGKKGSKVFF
jgi:hypothetical protein